MEDLKDFEELKYEKAKKKANNIRAFYYQLTAYCVIIPVLIFINLTFVPEFHWFWFSMIGWGTGVIMHGMEAFDLNPFLGKNWEERKLKQFVEEEKRKQEKTNKLFKDK